MKPFNQKLKPQNIFPLQDVCLFLYNVCNFFKIIYQKSNKVATLLFVLQGNKECNKLFFKKLTTQ